MPSDTAVSCLPSYVCYVLEHFAEQNPTETSDGWECTCPCPEHGRGQGDQHPSIRITVGDEGRLLVHCRTGCSTAAVLHAVDLRYGDLWPGDEDEPLPAFRGERDHHEPTAEELAHRDRVYSWFLERHALNVLHRKQLEERGFSPDAIEMGMYRSVREKNDGILKAALKQFGDTLFAVPGFRPQKNKTVAAFTTRPEGIYIPCVNVLGQIIAIKMRRTQEPKDGESRYYYLSGGAVSCGSPPHFPRHGTYEDTVRITEGELKADLATARTGLYTIGLAGVSQWRDLASPLTRMKIKRVIVAYDWPDVENNSSVFAQWDYLLSHLEDLGIRVAVERWPDHKGIDDALLAGVEITTVEGEELQQLGLALRRKFHPAATCLTTPVEPETSPLADGWTPAPFPLDVLPCSVQSFLTAVANSKQCPVDFPAIASLVIGGSLLGSSRAVRIMDGWVEKPILYAVIVAPPGSSKSPALGACLSPVHFLQRLLYKRRIRKGSSNPPDTPEEVQMIRLLDESEETSDTIIPNDGEVVVSDTTTEALAQTLQRSPYGVLLYRDELTAWVRSMDQYKGGKGTDRQFFLSCWSSEPIYVHRKSSGELPIEVHNPFISVLGGIQPDMLSELEDRGGREDGFLHRLLFSFPQVQLPDHLNLDGLPMELTIPWKRLVLRLLQARPINIDEPPRELPLSPEALEVFTQWYDAHLDEQRDPDFPQILKGPWAKFQSYTARFALVLHYLHVGSRGRLPGKDAVEVEQVEREDMERAVQVVNYFKSHTRGVYRQLRSSPLDGMVGRLVSLARRQTGGMVSRRMARQYLHMNENDAVVKLFKRAENLGLGVMDQVKGKRKFQQVFILNGAEDN